MYNFDNLSLIDTATSRIQKDIKEVNSIQDWDTPPMYVHLHAFYWNFESLLTNIRFCQVVNDNLEHVEALILGPPDTPYEFGFFKFGNTSFCNLIRRHSFFVNLS